VPAGAPGSTHSDDDVVVPVNGSLLRTTPAARAKPGVRVTNPAARMAAVARPLMSRKTR